MPADRLSLLQQFHAEDPGDAFTCFALAQEYAKRGEHLKACALYESLVQTQPSYTGTYYHLGKLYLHLRRPEAARKVFLAGIEVSARANMIKDCSELRQALMDLDDG